MKKYLYIIIIYLAFICMIVIFFGMISKNNQTLVENEFKEENIEIYNTAMNNDNIEVNTSINITEIIDEDESKKEILDNESNVDIVDFVNKEKNVVTNTSQQKKTETEEKNNIETKEVNNQENQYVVHEEIKQEEQPMADQETNEEIIQLDFSKYDRYYPALNGGYTCFKKNPEEIAKLKGLIEDAIQEFGYKNVKIVEDSSIISDRYFTANRTNVQNVVYNSEDFTIHYYAETEYGLTANGEEFIFQVRSYAKITGQ